MKSIFTLFLLVPLSFCTFATNYSINIVGTSYSPDLVTCKTGDIVTIQASTMHPLVQVDKATWEANGNTPMDGGWGVQTTSYEFHATVADTIYFVCQAHVGLGMKGRIIVQALTSGITDPTISNGLLSIYPNPASSFATFEVHAGPGNRISLDIYSMTGERVKSIVSGQIAKADVLTQDVSLDQLPGGEYICVVTVNNRRYIKNLAVLK